MKRLSRIFVLPLILILLLAVAHSDEMTIDQKLNGHELEYVQRFFDEDMQNSHRVSILSVSLSKWGITDSVSEKPLGTSILLYADWVEKALFRQYSVNFYDDGTLYSSLSCDYEFAGAYPAEYRYADTLYLADRDQQLNAAKKGLTSYLSKLFDGKAEEYIVLDEVTNISEMLVPDYSDNTITPLATARIQFSFTLQKDSDWAKSGQTYYAVWNLAHNRLDYLGIESNIK